VDHNNLGFAKENISRILKDVMAVHMQVLSDLNQIEKALPYRTRNLASIEAIKASLEDIQSVFKADTHEHFYGSEPKKEV